ncbi:MAG TPA: DUF6356 family protein [Sphingomicrobium sp.]|jgi:hypothetical protein|nr:DUF6356 family protein [Sphingomicrobium sp.]
MNAMHHNGNLTERLFVEHPRSLGMSWGEHGAGAAKIGFELIAVGFACLVHAVIPALFAETTSNTINRLHAHIAAQRTASHAERAGTRGN